MNGDPEENIPRQVWMVKNTDPTDWLRKKNSNNILRVYNEGEGRDTDVKYTFVFYLIFRPSSTNNNLNETLSV